MSDRPVLDFLQVQFARLNARLDGVDRKQDEIITRLGSVERDLAGVRTDFVGLRLQPPERDLWRRAGGGGQHRQDGLGGAFRRAAQRRPQQRQCLGKAPALRRDGSLIRQQPM
jgi:hypothetical protein